MLAGIVVVLVVGAELDVPADREQAARIERGGAPLTVLALVKRFGGDIGDEVIGVNRQGAI